MTVLGCLGVFQLHKIIFESQFFVNFTKIWQKIKKEPKSDKIAYLIFPSLAAGESGTIKRTWMGSVGLPPPTSAPPTILKPQLAFSFRCRITVFGYWRLRGIFCQYIHDGIKLEAPKEVSGPSMIPRTTWSRLIVAFKVATACEWVSPHKLLPSTDSSRSPFCNEKPSLLESLVQNN